MTELCDLSATALQAMIAEKKVSPVDIMQSCIARYEAVDGALNALVTPAFDSAMAAAQRAEDLAMRGEITGPLHGLPVAVKDLEATAGIRTTHGSRLYADDVPDFDQGSVARLRAAGGIILGKTNTPEFGTGGNTRNRLFGATGNPFAPNLTCGGSSGGAAVVLATGMAPLATGSDYGGSLRTPASFCGVVGYRPSPGVIPIEDNGVGLLPFAVLGPMGRTVDDAVLLLQAMAGFDRRDHCASQAYQGLLEPLPARALDGLRAAFSPDLGTVAMSQANRSLFAERTALFRHQFAAADDDAPEMDDVHHAFEVLRAIGYIAAFGPLVAAHRDDLSPNVIDNVERGYGFSITDVATAHMAQTRLAHNWLEFFDDYDVLICPATSVQPFAHANWSVTEIDGVSMDSYMRWLGIVYAPTMALACSVVLPCGVDANGLPFGIQLLGPPGGDRKLLEIAKAVEAVLADNLLTRRPLPDLSRLAGPSG